MSESSDKVISYVGSKGRHLLNYEAMFPCGKDGFLDSTGQTNSMNLLIQVADTGSTRARSALRWCPCASCIWLLHPAPIPVPKMVLTLCNLCWWCFSFHQLAKILHLQSWSSSPAATCAGGVFPWSTSAFTNVRTNKYAQIATCTVWWWWWLWLIVSLCSGDNCMWWWWLYVVVVAVLEGDGHPCVAVVVLLYDYIRVC